MGCSSPGTYQYKLGGRARFRCQPLAGVQHESRVAVSKGAFATSFDTSEPTPIINHTRFPRERRRIELAAGLYLFHRFPSPVSNGYTPNDCLVTIAQTRHHNLYSRPLLLLRYFCRFHAYGESGFRSRSTVERSVRLARPRQYLTFSSANHIQFPVEGPKGLVYSFSLLPHLTL
jgi:hypothetical protein